MPCGARTGKVGGGGVVHVHLLLAACIQSREVRRLHRFMPHAEGAYLVRGWAVGMGVGQTPRSDIWALVFP